ncbi:LOW QUALITY PROTEIN: hypothetical protein AAY473_037845 [Plecturocebus cupreus]
MPRAIHAQGYPRCFKPVQTVWGCISLKAVPAGISRSACVLRGCSIPEGLPGREQNPTASGAACHHWISPCGLLSLSPCGQIKWDAVSHGMKSQRARYHEELKSQQLKEFLEREDKDGLCCKRSPKLKIEELNVPLAGELETMKILSNKVLPRPRHLVRILAQSQLTPVSVTTPAATLIDTLVQGTRGKRTVPGTPGDTSILRRSLPLSLLPHTDARRGPRYAARTHLWQFLFARLAAEHSLARCPLPLGALQQRAFGQTAVMAGSRHGCPVAGVAHAASLCAAAAARGREGVGEQPAAVGHELRQRDLPWEPCGAGWGWGQAGMRG